MSWQARRKQFFFEKKNQKTLTLSGAYRPRLPRQLTEQSFLVLFFKKELLAYWLCGLTHQLQSLSTKSCTLRLEWP
jgi:hypothetical protein